MFSVLTALLLTEWSPCPLRVGALRPLCRFIAAHKTYFVFGTTLVFLASVPKFTILNAALVTSGAASGVVAHTWFFVIYSWSLNGVFVLFTPALLFLPYHVRQPLLLGTLPYLIDWGDHTSPLVLSASAVLSKLELSANTLSVFHFSCLWLALPIVLTLAVARAGRFHRVRSLCIIYRLK